jgi:oligosaccharide repeat unit polymerase
MWLIDLTVYRLDLITTDPLHPETLTILGLGALLFTFGGTMAMLTPKKLIEARFIVTRFPPRNTLVKPLLMAFLSCGLPLMLWSLMRTAAQGGTGGSIFARARAASVGDNAVGGGIPFLAYFSLWSFYAVTLFLIERRDRKFWLMALIAFVAAILTTGRGPILFLIAELTCVHLMMTGRHTFFAALKFARIPIFLFFCLYTGLIFLNKDTSTLSGGIGAILLFYLVSYIVGPMAAFDYVLQHIQDYAGQPNHTFKFFLGIASALHLTAYETPAVYDNFVLVPYPANVYTVYKFYYLDFGLYGMLLAITVIGLLQTLLYRKARAGSTLSIYLFAISIFSLIMVIFDDNYSALGSYIDAILFGMIYIFLRSIPMRVMPRTSHGSVLSTS